MKVLVIDVGGTHVKILATGQDTHREFPSGSTLTPERMVTGAQQMARDWNYDVVSIAYPGPVLRDGPVSEPHNLGQGLVGFDFQAAFGRPVKVMNDAAMQALGSYQGGKMLFLGLGTGLGSTMVVEGIVEPLEMGHLPYKKGNLRELRGYPWLTAAGKERWQGLRRGRDDSPHRCTGAGRRGNRGRQCQHSERIAPRLSSRRQGQCVPLRVSHVGARRW